VADFANFHHTTFEWASLDLRVGCCLLATIFTLSHLSVLKLAS